VTAALDSVGETDRATAGEIDAARLAFREGGTGVEWHDTLQAAMRAAAAHTRPGDLVVLIGAQGMNEGKRMLLEETEPKL
jgi:UDP-N-acetylmuramoyl-L-alanyl-D-glutamate--2,6-diaminopimelate ligase